jgi:hypothetical protein
MIGVWVSGFVVDGSCVSRLKSWLWLKMAMMLFVFGGGN